MTDKKKDEIKDILNQMVPDVDENSQATFNNIDAGRDFVGGNQFKGSFAERDIVANVIGSNIANRDINHSNVVHNNIANSRPVTKTERRKLHKLVTQLEEQYGESGAKTWKSIHDILGIDNVESMLLEQLKPTETILNLLIENAKLRNASTQPSSVEQSLRQQLNQSANALTKLTERNGELAVNLKKHQEAYSRLKKYEDGYATLDAKCKKQASEIASLTSQLSSALEKSKRIRFVLATSLSVIAGILTIALGIQNIVLNRKLQAAEARVNVCEFEDKSYAIGSVLPTNYKCDVIGKGMPPQWTPMVAKSPKKTTPEKKMPLAESTDQKPVDQKKMAQMQPRQPQEMQDVADGNQAEPVEDMLTPAAWLRWLTGKRD